MENHMDSRWNLSVLAIIFTIFGIISVGFLVNTVELEKVMHRKAEVYVSDMNVYQAENLSYRINTNLDYLTQFARSVGSMPDLWLIEEILEQKGTSFGFDQLALYQMDGTVFPAVCDTTQIKTAIKNNPQIWEEPSIIRLDQNKILFSAPVLHNDQSTGTVMVGVKTYSGLLNLVNRWSKDMEVTTLVLDPNGELVIGSTGEEQLESGTQKELETLILDHITQMGSAYLQQDKKSFDLEIEPDHSMLISTLSLAINDWVQVTALPWDPTIAYTTQIKAYFWLSISFILVSAATVWYIFQLQKGAQKKLDKLAYCDFLTNGMTNLAFQIKCTEHFDREGYDSYTIVYFDIRDFEHINETWGMENGNRALQYIHHCLEQETREGELVARSEVDHFFLLLHENEAEKIHQRVNQMLQTINSFTDWQKECYQFSFAIGACMLSDGDADEDIHALQDRARRAAKFHNEINMCTFHNEAIIEKVNRVNRLNALFEESIKNHDFQVYLQPKVYLQQSRPCAAEALVRWVHPEEGMIYPSEFIPLFEENGNICQLDLYVFEEVCKMIDRWRQEHRPLSEISVNLSRVHMKKMETGFQKQYYEIKERYHIPDGIIQLELTETSVFYTQQLPYVAEIIKNFQKAGISCALDDFGFGYSSLSVLKELDVDTIKLDRSFFINESKKSRIVVSNMIHLAHDMNIEIVAEGIEDGEQVASLSELGCDLIQGYFYSKPLPIDQFELWQDEKLNRVR